jgi:hypothetical protein
LRNLANEAIDRIKIGVVSHNAANTLAMAMRGKPSREIQAVLSDRDACTDDRRVHPMPSSREAHSIASVDRGQTGIKTNGASN